MCTDGSGGSRSSDTFLRRCSWAGVVVTQSGEVLAGTQGTLIGSQTVPRAEITAVTIILGQLRLSTKRVTVWSDCALVVSRGAALRPWGAAMRIFLRNLNARVASSRP